MAETNNNDIKTAVQEFLSAIGYEYSANDDWMLMFCIDKVINTIKNSCNVSVVPEGLRYVEIQMIVGEYLFTKKSAGQTEGFENISFEAVAKSIQEGDTNISFAIGEGNSTPEQRLNALINYLQTNGKDEFVTYRKLKW